MKAHATLDNDIHYAERRHPVDFLEPAPTGSESIRRTCEVLSRTFGWVAEGDTVEQRGLRATVVLYCVRADLVGTSTLEEIGTRNGCPLAALERLVADFCHRIGWQ
ncbi:hypothetical protein BH09VER1_BH09VER1_11690 [soil metagenome]